ncbi:MAG: AbgT family transporter [Candidatus Riflebacteria bacterium]|nr:AbgT family transporter [Candidatus Riflebacteria bacterium]
MNTIDSNVQINKTGKSITQRLLDIVEKIGNRLPHPVTIFVIFSALVVILSEVAARYGVAVTFTAVDKTTKDVLAVSLLSADGIRYIFSSAVTNFTGFAPLGTVLVAMLGVGAAESTGLIRATLRQLVLSTPGHLITATVVFAGIMSNIASDAGYVVLVPLGALVFLSVGRHPLAGLAAAFAGVSGGFSANLLVGTLDPLLGGISTEAARFINPAYVVEPTANWYFMIASTFLITLIGTWVTEAIVEPRLGKYHGEHEEQIEQLEKHETRGLVAAAITALVFVLFVALLIVPEGGVLRNPQTAEILGSSPFMAGLVPLIALFFFFPGLAYGIAAGTIKNDKDIARAVGKSMNTMGDYLLLAFVAGQFVAYFAKTNLGTIIAVTGADFLKATGMTGIPLIVAFVLVSGFINLFIGSASAKWAIMAPVFVPMFMVLGYSPELTQLSYRIGDSVTNIISPLMAYFAVIVAFAQKYEKDIGLGTLISVMIPYSFSFMIGWTLMLIAWLYAGLPLGPGVHALLP